MAAHRNRLERNVIENNNGAGVRIRGYTNDLLFKNNVIHDTREGAAQTQVTGLLIEENVGDVNLIENKIEAEERVVDKRAGRSK
jgi:parallel beta-helix repeat protein